MALTATTTVSPQIWDLIKHFLEEKGLVRQHVDSYDEFIETGLQAIVDETGEIPIEIEDYPVMLRSKICPLSRMTQDELISIGEDPLDPGGYLMGNGAERVVVLWQ